MPVGRATGILLWWVTRHTFRAATWCVTTGAKHGGHMTVVVSRPARRATRRTQQRIALVGRYGIGAGLVHCACGQTVPLHRQAEHLEICSLTADERVPVPSGFEVHRDEPIHARAERMDRVEPKPLEAAPSISCAGCRQEFDDRAAYTAHFPEHGDPNYWRCLRARSSRTAITTAPAPSTAAPAVAIETKENIVIDPSGWHKGVEVISAPALEHATEIAPHLTLLRRTFAEVAEQLNALGEYHRNAGTSVVITDSLFDATAHMVAVGDAIETAANNAAALYGTVPDFARVNG
jgi:hypothetical protein